MKLRDGLRLAAISIGFAGAALFVSPMPPMFAHKTEVTGDVAGTWHVEPNHTPRAGELATVWIALTRKGGSVLPLAQANCQLGVYNFPRRQTDEPILQPALQAIAIEQYQGIPGAEVVFPKTGLYQLELGCIPKTEGSFAPFQMTYEVTVASGRASSGTASPASATLSPQSEPVTSPSTVTSSPTTTTQFNSSLLVYVLGAIATATLLGLGILQLRARK